MDDELEQIVQKMVAAGEPEDHIALVIKHYKPKPVAPPPDYNDSPEAVPQGTLSKDLMRGVSSFVKSAYSTLVDEIPKNIEQAGEVLQSAVQPTNTKEFINQYHQVDFQKYVRDKDPAFKGFSGHFTPFDIDKYMDKYGSQFMVDNGLSGKVKKMEANLPNVIKRRQGVEAFVQQQNKEAAEKTQGVVKDISDVKGLGDALSVAGNFVGQSISQIPLAVLTKGNSSLIMESAAVYDKQLDELAKKHEISREEVIKKNLDSPALNQQYAALAAVLDATSAGSILGAMRSGAVKSSAKKVISNILSEGITEAAQGNIERAAGSNAAGVEFDPLSKENLLATANETIAGALGGGVFSMNGVSKANVKEDIVNKYVGESSTGDPNIDAEIDQAAALSPEEDHAIRQERAHDVTIQGAEDVKIPELKLNEDAVQKQSTESLPVRERSESSKGVSESNTEGEEASSEARQKYEEGVAKLTDLKQRFADAPLEEDTSDLYNQIADLKHSLRQIAPEAKPSAKKTDIKSRIEDTTGVTKPEKSIKMSPNEAIKHQVQTFYKGVEEGVYRGKDASNELVSRVQEAMKNSPLEPRQISSILTRVKNTNLFTPGSISRLKSYIDKVSLDAEYANKIDEAKALNKSIRRLTKDKGNNQSLRSISKNFASINPEDTFINQHLDKGRSIVNALSKPSRSNYEAVNFPEAEEYVNDLKSKIETEGVAAQPKEEATKGKQLKISLRSAVEGLKNKDLSEFDESDKARIEAIKNIDPEALDDKQAQDAIRVIDNIVENDDLSNITKVESVAKAQQILKNLEQKLQGKKIEQIGKVGQVFNNTPQLFRQIFDNSTIAAYVQSEIGSQDLFAAGSRVENRESQRSHEYNEVAKEFNKTTKDDIRSPDNQAKLAVFSLLYRHVPGEPTNHIAKIKGNIEQTIATLEKPKPIESEAWQKAYDQFKDITTPEEALKVMEKSPELLKVWSFFPKMFSEDINEGLRKVTEEVHNKPFVEEENYTHIAIENISSNIKAKEAFSEGDVGQAGKIAPVQAKTSLKATRNLPPGFAYSTDFVGNQFKAYQQSLYDIEASRIEAQLKEILYSEKFAELVGGPDNVKIIQDQIKTGRDIQAGMLRKSTNLAVKMATGLTQYIRSIGAAKALGSTFGAVAKQSTPVIKALVNHTGSKSLPSFFQGLSTRITPDVRKLLNNSQIGVRRKRQGGTERGESLSHRLGVRADSKWARTLEKIGVSSEWLTNKSLWALTTTDATVAEKTWIGYYLQSLRQQGVKDVNMNEEYKLQGDEKRKKAVAFAEQLISETQLPSNPAELSPISRNDRNESLNILKNILLPFANYSLNAKRRLMLNTSSAFRNPTKQNIANVAGDAAEILAFAAVQVYLMSLYKDVIKNLFEKMTGIEPPDEDEDRKKKSQDKAFASNIANAVIPTSIGTIGENYTAKALNAIAYIATNPDVGFQQWKKDTGGVFYEKDAVDYGVLSLGAAPLVEAGSGLVDLTKTKAGEPVVTQDYMGNPKEVYLDKDQTHALEAKIIVELMSASGFNEADIFNQVRKVYKEQLKEAQPAPSGTKSHGRPRPRRRPIHHHN